MSVRVQIGARGTVGRRIFDLLVHRVCVDHDSERAGEVLVPQSCRAAEVDQSGCPPKKVAYLVVRKAVTYVVNGVPIGPAPPEAVLLHCPLQTSNVVVTFHDDAIRTGVEGVRSAVLDIPAVQAQPDSVSPAKRCRLAASDRRNEER